MVSFDPIIAHIRLRIQPVSESVPRRPSLETGCATSVPGAFSGEKAVENQRPFSGPDRKSTRLNSSHVAISYAVFCLKKKTKTVAGFPASRHHPPAPTRL